MYERNLIDYIPPFLRNVREYKAILVDAEQPEMVSLWEELGNAMRDQFIFDAGETSIERWERILGIVPKVNSTLDERKFSILTKMNPQLPYTYKNLEKSLATLCGYGNFEIQVYGNRYHIEVKLALGSKHNYQEVVSLLSEMLPANMTMLVQIMYNAHNVLNRFTHQELATFSHEQLRSEISING